MSAAPAKISTRGLSAWFDDEQVLRDIDIDIEARGITAIVGPSGCGKSTFIRCINRLHEVRPGARMSGTICLDGVEIQGRSADPIAVRRRIGMIFSKPNPFPAMSIRDNVLAGLRLTGRGPDRRASEDIVERSLRAAGLWDELGDEPGGERGDRLGLGVAQLSKGQQQRLCLARSLAVEPEILLLDEPCSVLDPAATAKIEDLLLELRERLTVVIVTHNVQQAARVSQRLAFFLAGELIEYDDTDTIYTAPRDKRTEDYITGKFG